MPETQLNVRLLSHTPDPVTAIALAGRLCYSDSDILSLREGVRGRAPQFVEKLASLGHLSPFEHEMCIRDRYMTRAAWYVILINGGICEAAVNRLKGGLE